MLDEVRGELGHDEGGASAALVIELKLLGQPQDRAPGRRHLTALSDWEWRLRRSSPTDNGHAGPFAGTRLDVELVGEPARTAEAQPEPAAGRIAIAQRQFDVGNARALIFEGQPQTTTSPSSTPSIDHTAAAAVLNGVAGELAGGGDDLRLIDEVEPELHRALANSLADADDVFCGFGWLAVR